MSYKHTRSAPRFFVAMLLLCAVAFVSNSASMRAQLAFFSPKDSAKGIVVKANADNVFFCTGIGEFPIIADPALAMDSAARFWVYKYTGNEPPHDGQYYISAGFTQAATKKLKPSLLTAFSLDGVFYVKTNKDLMFQCGAGLSEVPSTVAAAPLSMHAAADGSQQPFQCPRLQCAVPAITAGCRYVLDDFDAQGCRVGCGHVECQGNNVMNVATTTASNGTTQQSVPWSAPANSYTVNHGSCSTSHYRVLPVGCSEVCSTKLNGCEVCSVACNDAYIPVWHDGSASSSTALRSSASNTEFSSFAAQSSASPAESPPAIPSADLLLRFNGALCIDEMSSVNCQRLTESYTIVNDGPESASNVVLHLALHGSLHAESASVHATALSCIAKRIANSTLDCQTGTLAAGTSITVNVTATVGTPAPACGTVNFPASVDSQTSDPILSNNATQDAELTCGAAQESSASSSSESSSIASSFASSIASSSASSVFACSESASTHVIPLDLNGDGRTDFVALYNGTLTATLNTESGKFTPSFSRYLGNAVDGAMMTGDVNHDGATDIVAVVGTFGSDAESLGLYIVNPVSGRTQQVYSSGKLQLSSTSFGIDPTTGDIVGFVGQGMGGKLSRIHIERNNTFGANSAIAYATVQNLPVGPTSNIDIVSDAPWKGAFVTNEDLGGNPNAASGIHSIKIADIDGDGIDDAVELTSRGDDVGLQWISGADGSTHDLKTVLGGTSAYTGGKTTSFSFGDMNGDGANDILVTTNVISPVGSSPVAGISTGSKTYWMENQNHGLTWTYHILDTADTTDIASGDMNGDGKQDIVTAGPSTQFYLQTPDCDIGSTPVTVSTN